MFTPCANVVHNSPSKQNHVSCEEGKQRDIAMQSDISSYSADLLQAFQDAFHDPCSTGAQIRQNQKNITDVQKKQHVRKVFRLEHKIRSSV